MISTACSLDELLGSLAGCPLAHIIERVTAEKAAAEAMAKHAAEPLRSRMFDYVQACRCLKFWLTSKNKPRNCPSFPVFKPLTISLVAAGNLPASILQAFE